MNKTERKLQKLEKRSEKLGFWRLVWVFPMKGVLILSALATIISFPFSLVAGLVCASITAGVGGINIANHLLYDKIDAAFYEKIRKINIKIDKLKEQTITYEEYKNQNLNASTLVVNYPNGEKRVSTLFKDKGTIIVDEDEKTFETAVEIVTNEHKKPKKVSISENASYLRENFNEISEETNNSL